MGPPHNTAANRWGTTQRNARQRARNVRLPPSRDARHASKPSRLGLLSLLYMWSFFTSPGMANAARPPQKGQTSKRRQQQATPKEPSDAAHTPTPAQSVHFHCRPPASNSRDLHTSYADALSSPTSKPPRRTLSPPHVSPAVSPTYSDHHSPPHTTYFDHHSPPHHSLLHLPTHPSPHHPAPAPTTLATYSS